MPTIDFILGLTFLYFCYYQSLKNSIISEDLKEDEDQLSDIQRALNKKTNAIIQNTEFESQDTIRCTENNEELLTPDLNRASRVKEFKRKTHFRSFMVDLIGYTSIVKPAKRNNQLHRTVS